MAEIPRESMDDDVRCWLVQIEAYEKEHSPWAMRGEKIVKRYKDDRGDTTKDRARFNVLWSNVETLKPALYARDPKPWIERRFKARDPVGAKAAEALEKCVSECLSADDFGHIMRITTQDYLLVGRGTTWERYQPVLTPAVQPDPADSQADADTETGEKEKAEEQAEKLTYEWVGTDYVHWKDFGHVLGRVWGEVSGVWRKVYMTRSALVKRFGEKVGNEIPLDHKSDKVSDAKVGASLSKACIYEIWDKSERQVLFISKSYATVIETNPDPLQLKEFFPCPRPLLATVGNDTLIPVPDYALYQDQAAELDDLTARIRSLTKALKVAGVYDSSQTALARLLDEGHENKLVPVETWATFAQQGGLHGSISWLPIEEVANVLIRLYDARDKVKQDLYEITGLADIIRGNSSPSETATAQQIKGQFATLRLSDRQNEVQRFARDIVRLKAEIIAEHFADQTIIAMSGVDLLTMAEKQAIAKQQQMQAQYQQIAQQAQQQGMQVPPPPALPPIPPKKLELMDDPTWDDVLALLRNDPMRTFRIDIETDSTIKVDEDADKAGRIEFLQAVGQFLGNALQAAQAQPRLVPLLGEMLKFGVRGFKNARELEGAFDEALDGLEQAAKNPPPQPPNPDLVKIDKEHQARMTEINQKADVSKQELTIKQQQASAEMALEARLAKFEAALEAQSQAHSQALAQQKQEMDHQLAIERERAKADLAERTAASKAEAAAAKAEAGTREAGSASVLEQLLPVLQRMAAPKKAIYNEAGDLLSMEPDMTVQ